MRGFLLERHPRVTDMLACAFAHVGISLVRVTSLEALLDAADTAGPDEFLIIDLTLDGPDDLGRYAPVLGQAVVPVHIVYRDQAIPLLLAHAAASLVLLSVDSSWFACSTSWRRCNARHTLPAWARCHSGRRRCCACWGRAIRAPRSPGGCSWPRVR